MEAIAKLNNYPTSPRKMRLVIDLIRGKSCEQALKILKFNSKSTAPNIEKLLVSAINNWRAKNKELRVEDSNIYVKKAFVDCGRVLKRMLPAPQGRAYKIRKRSNHVTLIIDSKEIAQEVNSEQ